MRLCVSKDAGSKMGGFGEGPTLIGERKECQCPGFGGGPISIGERKESHMEGSGL